MSGKSRFILEINFPKSPTFHQKIYRNHHQKKLEFHQIQQKFRQKKVYMKFRISETCGFIRKIKVVKKLDQLDKFFLKEFFKIFHIKITSSESLNLHQKIRKFHLKPDINFHRIKSIRKFTGSS